MEAGPGLPAVGLHTLRRNQSWTGQCSLLFVASDLSPQHLHGYAAGRVPMLLLALPAVAQAPTVSRCIRKPPITCHL